MSACRWPDGKHLISGMGGRSVFLGGFWHQNLHDKPSRNGMVCGNPRADVFRTHSWATCLEAAARVSETLSY